MLIIGRTENENIVVTGRCIITVTDIGKGRVELGITADSERVRVFRFPAMDESQIANIAKELRNVDYVEDTGNDVVNKRIDAISKSIC